MDKIRNRRKSGATIKTPRIKIRQAPTPITDFIVEEVCNRLAEEGLSLAEAVNGLCPLRSFIRARDAEGNEAWRAQFEQATECRDERFVAEMRKICKSRREPKDKDVYVKTLQWISNRQRVKRLEISAPGGKPLSPFIVQVVASSD